MIITNLTQFNQSLKKFTSDIVVDTETSGLHMWRESSIAGIGICTKNYDTFYYPFFHKRKVPTLFEGLMEEHSEDNLPKELLPILISKIQESKTLIGHNLKFDLTGLIKEGLEITDEVRLEDTLTLSRFKYHAEDEKINLEIVSKRLLGVDEDNWKTTLKKYLSKKKIKNNYDYAEVNVLGPYCEGDVSNTLKIYDKLMEYVHETGQLPLWDQECELLKVIFQMERDGMFIDLDYCDRKIPQLKKKLDLIQQDIFNVFNMEFDILSNPQLGKAMNSIGIYSSKTVIPKRRRENQDLETERWDLEVLLNIEHPVGKMVLQFREVSKMMNTYFIAYSKWRDGYIHPNFKPWGTVTGRMSCTEPNLQNVMTKMVDTETEEKIDERIQEAFKKMAGSQSVSSRWIARLQTYSDADSNVAVKRMFVAPEGYQFYAVDFSQMEMRIFSDYVGDKTVISQLGRGDFDFHSFVATQVWGAKEDAPDWKFFRSIAKAINFGLIYGIGTAKLSIQIGKPEEEAAEYKKNYFRQFPASKVFINKVKSRIETEGYVTNLFKRRYYIDPERSYVGVNYLVQGSSADLVKNRMIALAKYFQETGCKTRMVCQIHDEVIFYVKDEEEHWIVAEIQRIMEENLFRVPMFTEISKGFNSWSEKSAVCLTCFEKKGKDGHECKKKKARRAS
jgi:DNA polymerase-1